MKRTVAMTIVAALLCGCATTTKPMNQPAVVKQLKRPRVDARKILPPNTKAKAFAPAHLKNAKSLSERSTVQVKADPQPDDLVVVLTRLEGGISGDAGTWGYYLDCAHDTNTHGFIWISIGNWGTRDTWALPFNATDSATNARTYVPCMVRYRQPTEKHVDKMFTEFRGQGPSGAKSLEDTFATKWAEKKKQLGKNADGWAMTADGTLIKLE